MTDDFTVDAERDVQNKVIDLLYEARNVEQELECPDDLDDVEKKCLAFKLLFANYIRTFALDRD